MDKDLDDLFAQVDDALEGVRIIACKQCHGTGWVGKLSLPSVCPHCLGGGKESTNDNEEVPGADNQ